MDVLPRNHIRHPAARNFETGISHRGVSNDIELGHSRRIRNDLIHPLLLLVQERNRERSREIQNGKAVLTKVCNIEHANLQRHRIRVRHMRKERVESTSVKRKPTQGNASRV